MATSSSAEMPGDPRITAFCTSSRVRCVPRGEQRQRVGHARKLILRPRNRTGGESRRMENGQTCPTRPVVKHWAADPVSASLGGRTMLSRLLFAAARVTSLATSPDNDSGDNRQTKGKVGVTAVLDLRQKVRCDCTCASYKVASRS